MAVRMDDGRRYVGVVMIVPVVVPVVVRVRMPVVVMIVTVALPGFVHRKLSGGHAGAHHFRGGYRGALNRQAAEGGPQFLERESGVQERSQDHVARCAGETVEIKNLCHEP